MIDLIHSLTSISKVIRENDVFAIVLDFTKISETYDSIDSEIILNLSDDIFTLMRSTRF